MKILIFCMSLLSCVANADLMNAAESAPTALFTVSSDETIESLVKVYTGYAAVYKYTSTFQCNDAEIERAKNMASSEALKQCYKAGYENCAVKVSEIIVLGYLGYRQEFQENMGWGCLAEATVHGK